MTDPRFPTEDLRSFYTNRRARQDDEYPLLPALIGAILALILLPPLIAFSIVTLVPAALQAVGG